jgi:hypothetical protein
VVITAACCRNGRELLLYETEIHQNHKPFHEALPGYIKFSTRLEFQKQLLQAVIASLIVLLMEEWVPSASCSTIF